MSIKKVGAALLSVIVMSFVCIVALFGGVQTAHAESPVAGSDGRYNVSYEIGGQSGIGAEMIAKYFERIGDHATNIAEWVEFSITGQHRGE